MVETVIPVLEERPDISKRRVQTGHVRVRTEVDTHQELVNETLEHGFLHVERRTIEREVSEAPPPREENGATIISLVEERAVVTRALFVVEEVVIRRSVEIEQVEIPVTLRATRAVIDTVPTDQQEDH